MSKQYLYRVSILSKKTSHPLDAIAHYCGEDQFDVINSKRYASNTHEQVVWSNIVVPDKINQKELFYNLPDYLKFRSQKPDLISNARNILWKNVDSREIRPDSQFARLFELAIPHFLTQAEAITLVSNFGKALTTEGMIADCSLHSHNKKSSTLSIFEAFKIINTQKEEKEVVEHSQDYTAFLICTLRDYYNGQFINKNRDWNNKEKMKEWRHIWTTFLGMAIEHAVEATSEEKNSWGKKISMYPEYQPSINLTPMVIDLPSIKI
jgi:hypothetical protein